MGDVAVLDTTQPGAKHPKPDPALWANRNGPHVGRSGLRSRFDPDPVRLAVLEVQQSAGGADEKIILPHLEKRADPEWEIQPGCRLKMISLLHKRTAIPRAAPKAAAGIFRDGPNILARQTVLASEMGPSFALPPVQSASFRAHPNRVVLAGSNGEGRAPLPFIRRADGFDASFPQHDQAVVRADPQIALLVLADRLHPVAAQTVGAGVMLDLAFT